VIPLLAHAIPERLGDEYACNKCYTNVQVNFTLADESQLAGYSLMLLLRLGDRARYKDWCMTW